MNNLLITPRRSNPTRSFRINKYIEIVASSNPRLNAMARDSQLSIQTALKKTYSKVLITIVNDIADLEKLVLKKPDMVVLGMKLVLQDPSAGYENSPKIWLSNYLDERNIDHTGSATSALMLEFNKPDAKQKVLDAGLQSSEYFISTMNEPNFKHKLTFPLFVKPTNRGDSKGVDEQSVAYSEEQLRSKILSIHNDCGSDALIEEYLPGREFSVAVIRKFGLESLHAMPIEIITPVDSNGNRFLSASVKKGDLETAQPVNDNELKNKINALAIGVFKALGSGDYGRIDVRLDKFGLPNFIEANLMPGLSGHGYLARCFLMNEGISYETMILSIVRLAFERAQTPLLAIPVNTLDNLDEILETDFAAGLVPS